MPGFAVGGIWVELVENSFGGESGSSLATKGLDGARYRKPFGAG